MSAPQNAPNISLDLISEILEHLSPTALHESKSPPSELQERQTALARCARACHAFQKPALVILWRDMSLTNAYRAPLSRCAIRTAFNSHGAGAGPLGNDEAWHEEVDADDNSYAYDYIDGPITPDEYARFEYYAQFIRILRYDIKENVNPTAYFFLQQHSHGRTLFPNLRELVWVHPVPEILSVLSPSIHVLRFPFIQERMENHCDPQEIGYRMIRHTFKTLLPGMLRQLPELKELELLPLRHEKFWGALLLKPTNCFVAQSLRSLHLSEPLPVLLRGALAVVSTIKGLEELKITPDLPLTQYEPTDTAELAAQGLNYPETIQPFEKLRKLSVSSHTQAVALLIDLIVAPNLEEAALHCHAYPSARQLHVGEYTSVDEVDALHEAVQTLCSRNAQSLLSVKLLLLSFKLPQWRRVNGGEKVLSLDALIKPLLQLRRLRDLVIDLQHIHNTLKAEAVPDMLAAWPTLRCLNIPVLSISPDDLRVAARICPELRSVRVMRLSVESLILTDAPLDADTSTAAEASHSSHPLQELRLYWPSKTSDTGHAAKIARFLHDLFPQLDSAQCVGGKVARRYVNQKDWQDIILEVKRLQDGVNADDCSNA